MIIFVRGIVHSSVSDHSVLSGSFDALGLYILGCLSNLELCAFL